MESFLKGFGVGLMVVGAVLVFGSVEPAPTTTISQVVAIALTGFALVASGWRVYVASLPRTTFVKRW